MPILPLTRVGGRESIAKELLNVESSALLSLDAYFKLYNSLVNDDFLKATSAVPEYKQALRTHEDILNVARNLKLDPNRTRLQVRSASFLTFTESPGMLEDRNRAIDISARLMLMINCSAYLQSPRFEIDGFRPSTWKDNQTFADFVTSSLPPGQPVVHLTSPMLKKLKAWKLRRAHLELIATDNLVEHLLYDPDDNSVRIFHHAAFLKAQIRRTSGKDLDCDMVECLKMGALPPRVLLETLHSLQTVLFRPYDEKSTKLLRSLIKTEKFDNDCLEPGGHITKDGLEYRYWGMRLAKLHEIVNDPQPSGPFHSWLRRNANEKNAFYIAIISLVLSAFFSFLGVIIGIIQNWLAWKAWKSPTS